MPNPHSLAHTVFDLDILAQAVRTAVAHGVTADQINDAVSYGQQNPTPTSRSRVGVPSLPTLDASGFSDFAAVVVRDPDGDATVTVYHRNDPITVDQFHVDPGRGYSNSEWDQMRLNALAGTSGQLRVDLARAYGDMAESEFITGPTAGANL